MSENKGPIVIIDGLNVFLRHFCANPTTTASGELVGGVVGFVRFVDWIISNMSPQKLFVVWEKGGGSAKRKSIYPEYKANRARIKGLNEVVKNNSSANSSRIIGDEQNKQKQLLTLVDVLKYLPICQMYHSECECDDIIAYMVRQKFTDPSIKKIVISSDKDFYQLLERPDVLIYDQSKKSYVSDKDVLDRFGIHPRNFVLARTMDGDESDNVSGIKGVGFKTLLKAFPEFADGSKEINITTLMESCKQKVAEKNKLKVYQSILDNENIVKRNWQLMYLGVGTMSALQADKINSTLESFVPKFDQLNFIKSLLKQEIVTTIDFNLLASRIRNCLLIS